MKFQLIPLDKIIRISAPPKRTGKVNQIHPIKVRPVNDMFEIVDGHGRVLVAEQNGETEIWAQVQDMDSESFHLQSLAANLSSRENPMKMARDINALMELGYSQSEISRTIGGSVSQSRISQLHSLTTLIPELQQRLSLGECPVKAGLLAVELPAELQQTLAETDGNVTIKQAKEMLTQFKDSMFSLDDLPEMPDSQPAGLFLNGDSYDKLAQGEVIEIEWNGLKVQVKAV